MKNRYLVVGSFIFMMAVSELNLSLPVDGKNMLIFIPGLLFWIALIRGLWLRYKNRNDSLKQEVEAIEARKEAAMSEKEKFYRTLNWVVKTSFKLFLLVIGLGVLAAVMH